MRTLTGPLAAVVYDGADWEQKYQRKFRARRAIVLAAVNHGWSLDDCQRTLLDEHAVAVSGLWTRGEDGRPLGSQAALRRLNADYRACSALATERPVRRSAGEVKQFLGEKAAEVRARPWPGRTGRTDQAVLLAVLAIATKAGTWEPDCSVRDIALRAGITRKTGSASLRRLCGAGWLEPVHNARQADHARRYRVRQVTPHRSLRGVSVETYVARNDARHCADAAHEVWVRLGKASRDLWCALDSAPRSARALAERAAVSPRTADRQLPRLASYRLAERRDAGWIQGAATPDDVVNAEGWLGANSRVERRRSEYAEERKLYATRDQRRGRADAERRADDLAARRRQREADRAPAAPTLTIVNPRACARHQAFGAHPHCLACAALSAAAS